MPIRKTGQKHENPEETKRIEAVKAKQAFVRQQEEDKEMTARIEAAKAKNKKDTD
jgi:hypothetical protein